jgi:UDP-N-acetylglucosamine--N-acetylmuramyl-(pentapeptide) pyrophosphoryl-undecaprenol N-acetylglucosamine transferase
LYPGLAVADELTRLDPDSLVVFACSDREIDRRILDPLDHAIAPQPVRPFTKNPLKMWDFLQAWRKSNALAGAMISDLQPRAVLGLGGFAAGPVVRVAAGRRVPTAMLNPDSIPGRANEYLARRVDVIFTQFSSTAGCFAPALRKKVRQVGCPVRRDIVGGNRDEAMRRFGLSPGRKVLLVFGGSALAESITEAVVALAPDLEEFAEQWQVLLVAGPKKYAQASGAFGGACLPVRQGGIHASVLEYCRRMDLAYAAADLAVCRGGAGTIAELAATGTPAVILPYPWHGDRQQYKNAADGLAAGCLKIVEDSSNPEINAKSLRAELLPILRDATLLERMRVGPAENAAVKKIAQWLAENGD